MSIQLTDAQIIALRKFLSSKVNEIYPLTHPDDLDDPIKQDMAINMFNDVLAAFCQNYRKNGDMARVLFRKDFGDLYQFSQENPNSRSPFPQGDQVGANRFQRLVDRFTAIKQAGEMRSKLLALMREKLIAAGGESELSTKRRDTRHIRFDLPLHALENMCYNPLLTLDAAIAKELQDLPGTEETRAKAKEAVYEAIHDAFGHRDVSYMVTMVDLEQAEQTINPHLVSFTDLSEPSSSSSSSASVLPQPVLPASASTALLPPEQIEDVLNRIYQVIQRNTSIPSGSPLISRYLKAQKAGDQVGLAVLLNEARPQVISIMSDIHRELNLPGSPHAPFNLYRFLDNETHVDAMAARNGRMLLLALVAGIFQDEQTDLLTRLQDGLVATGAKKTLEERQAAFQQGKRVNSSADAAYDVIDKMLKNPGMTLADATETYVREKIARGELEFFVRQAIERGFDQPKIADGYVSLLAVEQAYASTKSSTPTHLPSSSSSSSSTSDSQVISQPTSPHAVLAAKLKDATYPFPQGSVLLRTILIGELNNPANKEKTLEAIVDGIATQRATSLVNEALGSGLYAAVRMVPKVDAHKKAAITQKMHEILACVKPAPSAPSLEDSLSSHINVGPSTSLQPPSSASASLKASFVTAMHTSSAQPLFSARCTPAAWVAMPSDEKVKLARELIKECCTYVDEITTNGSAMLSKMNALLAADSRVPAGFTFEQLRSEVSIPAGTLGAARFTALDTFAQQQIAHSSELSVPGN